ncbi:MAG TPA: short chain dehydrogenase [Polyangia bacterium]|jgi:NAD(P)-dependent dehydrogenase (short-subunit alcohol dehydrogenase family)|nr:short chain dehydrogenase [Polyangia bacterium]
MKIIVVGATGTIGSEVAKALGARHEIVSVSRSTQPAIDYAKPESITGLFEKIGAVDAVISCAGGGVFKPLDQLTDTDIEKTLQDKLMGQVRLALAALRHVKPNGSITVTGGVMSHEPMPGGAAISLVNAGLEGFVRGASIEAKNGVRINLVSPPWVTETLKKFGMTNDRHLSAAHVARAYVASVEGRHNGEILDPARF